MQKKYLLSFFFFSIVIGAVYSNTLSVPWHFDDKPNIVNNQRLHMNELSIDSLKQAFFSGKGNGLQFRPLPIISFAINWYFNKNNTMFYHVVNIAIHIAVSFFLYLTILEIFNTPKMKTLRMNTHRINTYIMKGCGSNDDQENQNQENQNNICLIALVTASLWGLNPIQTQSVTYIVQRITQMATLFYILAIFFYLKARLDKQHEVSQYSSLKYSSLKYSSLKYWCSKYWCYLLVIVFFICAIMSKENAILLPVSLVLIEIIFFHNTKEFIKKEFIKKEFIKKEFCSTETLILSLIIIISVVTALYLFGNGNILFFLQGYSYREFTLIERVLTESRIVLFYISEIFYPLPSRLSITHDFPISKSLFTPFTTLPSILIIAVLIWGCIIYRKKAPLLSFAVLFFFLNHIVESTIIPLELIFEHRNYLPSLFIFLPVASGVSEILNNYKDKNRLIYFGGFFCIICWIISFGNFTYQRNKVWKSSESLWYDAFEKSPANSRANNNLAIELGWGSDSNYQKQELALKLLNRSLSMPSDRKLINADTLANMALIYFNRGNYTKALELEKKALVINPNQLKTRFEFVKTLFMLKEWDKALSEVNFLIEKSGQNINPDYYHFKGFILLWLNKPEDALYVFQKALKSDPYNLPAILMSTGCALSRVGEYKRAEWFYKFAQENVPLSIQTFFLLIENSIRTGEIENSTKYAKIMFSHFDIYSILRELNQSKEQLEDQHKTLPLDRVMIAPVIDRVIDDSTYN